MVNSDKSIFEYDISPFKQGGAVLVGMLVFMVIATLLNKTGLMDIDPNTPWLIACSMSFFFAIGNSILSLAADDPNSYWWQSILSFVLLAVLGGTAAYFLSGLSIDEAGSFRWLFFVFAFGHVLFLAIVRTIKRIVKLAQKEDKRLRGED